MAKNDWRLANQMDYLYGVYLIHDSFFASGNCDHKHCSFCWEKFGEGEGQLHTGFHTLEDRTKWICERCFIDFKEQFNWVVVQDNVAHFSQDKP